MIRAPRYLAAVAALALICSVADAVGRAEKQPPAKPLDLNTASVEQLEQLPGVGPVTAKAIVRFRTKSGPFRRIEDLLAIRGITKRKLEKLRPYVTVAPAAPAKKNQLTKNQGFACHPERSEGSLRAFDFGFPRRKFSSIGEIAHKRRERFPRPTRPGESPWSV